MDINIEEIKENFGKTLRAIRNDKKISQLELGVKCGKDDSYISKIERGIWDSQLSTIFILAKGLEVEAKELLDFDKYLKV